MVERQRVSVYQRNGISFVVAEHLTVDGFWVAGRVRQQEATYGPQALGSTILSALADSTTGVPTPSPQENLNLPLLSASGCRSWAAFARGAEMNAVERGGCSVVVERWTRSTQRADVFEPADKIELGQSVDAEAVGQAVLDSFQQ